MPVTTTRTALALRSVFCLALWQTGCHTTGGSSDANLPASDGAVNPRLRTFSFFVVSVGAVRALSGSPNGFGGDLRHGETGDGAGLRGADKICRETAERAMPGAGAKTWRAFLSTTTGGAGGGPVHAGERVGAGPWHDAVGRLVASNLTQLLMDRPGDADLAIRADLPNEYGLPNHMDGAPGCAGSQCPNNHAILTGTGTDGRLYATATPITDSTCNDWTDNQPTGAPRCGHSWPRTGSGTNWMSSSAVDGCAPCTGPNPSAGSHCVGITGGYGGFYCLAVTN